MSTDDGSKSGDGGPGELSPDLPETVRLSNPMALSEERRQEAPTPPETRARLVVLRSGEVLQTIAMSRGAELTLGRTSQCDVVIPDSSVSRLHARVRCDAHGAHLEDLGSANGTSVDGQPVSEPQTLFDGQEIRLGQRSVDDPILLRYEAILPPADGFAGPRDAPSAPPQLVPIGERPEPPASPTPIAAPPRSAPHPTPVTASSLPPREALSEPPTPPTTARPSSSAEPAVAPPAGTGNSAASVAPPAPAVDEETVTSMPALPPSRSPASSRPRWVLPAAVTAGIGALLVAAWLGGLLGRAPDAPWRDVLIEPVVPEPGSPVTLVSRDIEALPTLRLLLEGREVVPDEVRSGRLQLTLPEGSEVAGSHPLELVVEAGGRLLYAGTLAVQRSPRVAEWSPSDPRVGDLLTLRGSGLVDAAGDVAVWVGSEPAVVEAARPTLLQVRVPVVTRQETVQAVVRLATAGLETSTQPIAIGVRQSRPLHFQFVAAPNGGVWEVQHPLGTAFRLDRPQGAPGEVPPDVQAAADAWTALFEAVAPDTDTSLTVRSVRGRFVLEASLAGEDAPRRLVSWTPADLAATAHPRAVVPELHAEWIAAVTDDFLEVFCRGRQIGSREVLEPYAEALNQLVELNLASGGNGRPEMADWERLGPLERTQVADAFLVAKGAESLAGRWHVQLSNAFYPEDEYEVHLLLDLDQRGRTLRGKAVISFGGSTIEFALPESPVSGRIVQGTPPTVELEMTFNRPVETLQLKGTLVGDGMGGSFSASGSTAAGERAWQATRLR